jgi:uncharacterized protein YlxW (UPF0749 family)
MEMPTAGRRPESVTGPIGRPIPHTPAPSDGDDDDPTVATTLPSADRSDQETRPLTATTSPSADRSDQETRPLTATTSPSADRSDQETRPLSRPAAEETRVLRRPPEDGETRVLRPPSDTATTPPGAGLSTAETLNLDDEPTVERGRPGEATEQPPRVKGVDDPVASGDGDARVQEKAGESPGGKPPAKKKVTSAGALIWVLLLLLGYTLVVQLRSNNDDQGLATARQEDLVSILSDLESRDSRLQTEIQSLESSQRQLTSGVSSRQAALAEAEKRADELGLLAGTLPGKGPGLKITIDKVKASQILNAVQELRGAGGEVMELAGVGGTAVRIVASSYFVDAQGGGIDADGTRLNGPWTLWVIGSPETMRTALQIPGGVVASINGAGGSVTMESQTMVEVTAVRKAGTLQYAKPTS